MFSQELCRCYIWNFGLFLLGKRIDLSQEQCYVTDIKNVCSDIEGQLKLPVVFIEQYCAIDSNCQYVYHMLQQKQPWVAIEMVLYVHRTGIILLNAAINFFLNNNYIKHAHDNVKMVHAWKRDVQLWKQTFLTKLFNLNCLLDLSNI